MGTVHVPLGESERLLNSIPDATPEQRSDALAYLRRRDALDVAIVLGFDDLGGDAA